MFFFGLQWVRMNPKARQAKSKARLARYDSLSQADEAADAAASASLESIFIPPGNPLGTTVVEAKVIVTLLLPVVTSLAAVDGDGCGGVDAVM